MAQVLMRALLSALSPTGPRGRLSTLIFHRVLPHTDPLFPGEMDVPRFDALCAWLASTFNVLPLDDAVQRLRERRLPSRALAITFDDGYADNHDHAMPVLAKHGLNATFFIATGMLEGGCMWNDRVIEAIRRSRLPSLDLRLPGLPSASAAGTHSLHDAPSRRAAVDTVIDMIKYLPPLEREAASHAVAQAAQVVPPADLMLSWQQLRAMHGGGQHIGAHTVSHPILRGLDEAEARTEIVDSRTALESALGARVPLFAYPNGKPQQDYDATSVALVREAGFDAAVSTAWGSADSDTDRFQIPRFTPWDTRPLRAGLHMARNLRQRAAATA